MYTIDSTAHSSVSHSHDVIVYLQFIYCNNSGLDGVGSSIVYTPTVDLETDVVFRHAHNLLTTTRFTIFNTKHVLENDQYGLSVNFSSRSCTMACFRTFGKTPFPCDTFTILARLSDSSGIRCSLVKLELDPVNSALQVLGRQS